MKKSTAQQANSDPRPRGLKLVAADTAAKDHVPSPLQTRRAGGIDGIEVHEDELGLVTAQRLYKMRCECGRSWFELELPKLAKCPACARLCLVTS
jgi:hypothetical protein